MSREAKELLEKKLRDVEHSEAALKLEVSRLKDVAEMAKEQSALFTLQEQLKNNELTSLQQQLLEHQTKSDDKATIGTMNKKYVLRTIYHSSHFVVCIIREAPSSGNVITNQ